MKDNKISNNSPEDYAEDPVTDWTVDRQGNEIWFIGKERPDTTILRLYVEKDEFGNFVLLNGEKVWIDEIVLRAFKGIAPKGKTNVRHINGDIYDDSVDNLCWQNGYLKQREMADFMAFKKEAKLTMNPNGVIRKNGKVCKELLAKYDTTTADCLAFPLVAVMKDEQGGNSGWSKRILVQFLGKIEGDPESLENPAILHKNMDNLDFSFDNLVWVEDTDPRYIEYRETWIKKFDEFKSKLSPDNPYMEV